MDVVRMERRGLDKVYPCGLAAFALYTSSAAHYLFELESVEDDWDRIVESEPDISRQRETAGRR